MRRYGLALLAGLLLLPACRGALEGTSSAGTDVNIRAPITDQDASTRPPDNQTANNQTPNNQTPNNQTPNNQTPNNQNQKPNNQNDGSDAGADVNEPAFDAGACEGTGFGEDFTVSAVASTKAQGRLHATATSGGGAVLAWRDAGEVHITHVDGSGAVVSDHTVSGDDIYGLAVHDDARAVMVSRDSDILALAILAIDGAVISDQTIIGDVPHDVTDNEWFGPLIREGRMIWTGTEWATYFAVQRLWPDGVAHYGDQLRTYTADGSSHQTIWGWGCSHSMEMRLSHNGDRLGPICASDCYPSKGVHFNHRGGALWTDEQGSNCAGGYGTSLGGSIAIPGGFWAAFTATDQRASADVALVKISGTTAEDPVWLTEDATADTDLNAVSYRDHLLVAWNADGINQFVMVDSTDGSVLEGPVAVADAELASSSDFFEFANGDVGWVQRADDGSVGLARLRACP